MFGQKFLRGQVWWIKGKEETTSSVQARTRPHLIVSNNVGNRNGATLIVIPFTTEEKADLPTHYICEFNGKKNTLLAEQIKTVDAEEMLSYMYMLDDKTMDEIDKVIMIALGIVNRNKDNYEKHTYEILNKDNFADDRIRFNINKRGRIWNNESKLEFIKYVNTYGLDEASKKYNTKNNTKQYYSRFCKTLNIKEEEV